jgi:hypothetical protein
VNDHHEYEHGEQLADATSGDGGPAAPPPAPAEPGHGAADLTGHPVVDAVVSTVEGLHQRPVDEHVAVFESAHEQLRAALVDVDGS